MIKIKLPASSIKYILFQRTCYLKDNYIFYCLTLLGCFKLFHNLSINLKSILFLSKIKTEFSKDMESEYAIIRPYLPMIANSILDIGCGVAGIDVIISNHYKNKIDIFLVDKTYVDKKVYYNFEKKGSFYNSLQISRKILEINSIDPSRIYLQEATEKNDIMFKNKFDIVISLISWGFHYPVLTYLDSVYKKMNENGILILDIRKDTGGEKEIEKIFGNYKIIFNNKTFIRILAKK